MLEHKPAVRNLQADAFVDIMIVAEHLADKLDAAKDRIDVRTDSIGKIVTRKHW